MKYLFFPLRLLWRAWFYVLVLGSIIAFLPIFLILTSREDFYPIFWKFMRFWSYLLLYGTGFGLAISKEQEIEKGKNYMFCPNHASLMDGWKLIVTSKNPIVFVGKKELEKIPFFGFFYKKVAITVDRSNKESRKSVYHSAKRKLDRGYSIVIFPEGLVPTEDVILAPFRNGAFSLAIEYQIPIVPQVYYDGKRLFSWDIFKGHPGIFRIKQLKFIETKGMTSEDMPALRDKTFKLIETELLNDEFYMKDTNDCIKSLSK